jgi:hypothetical protein
MQVCERSRVTTRAVRGDVRDVGPYAVGVPYSVGKKNRWNDIVEGGVVDVDGQRVRVEHAEVQVRARVRAVMMRVSTQRDAGVVANNVRAAAAPADEVRLAARAGDACSRLQQNEQANEADDWTVVQSRKGDVAGASWCARGASLASSCA